ncbi:phage integrase SAM-like domain-containing protein [Flavobacterium sp.]|uniref:phage integrase SAM-like domain-containing protein n=1 Tax=Flavobacterium sp. TaxID=239 RepID=UPI00286DD836|nr:phage integrase SAM-like domain-containing protein [Flavobacterium sp.]
MAKVNFRLNSKANKEVSIYVYLTSGRGNFIELKTGFSINPKEWSKETKRPKYTTTENKLIFNNLKKLESFIFNNLNKDLGTGVIIDGYWLESNLVECFNRVEKVDSGLILNHTQYIIDNANTRKVQGRNKLGLSQSRVKSYNTFKNLFDNYQTVIKKQVHFLDINKTFVDKFINWLVNTKGYSMNYAGKQIDNLKTVCLDAEKLDIPTNPFINQIQGFSENDDDRYIQTLSFVELEQIRTAEITKSELINARKWLLIGCEIGQRQSDLMNVTPDNIRYKGGNMYLDIIQQKTNKNVTIGIIAPHVKDILENDFPHKISSQKLNTYIKKVCETAKINEMVEGRKLIVTKTGKRILNIKGKYIDESINRKKLDFYHKYELITSHSFRRSFCTNYYKKIPTAVLIGISGHSKESLFLSYINQREDKDTNADLFMKFYEDLNKDKPAQMVLLPNGTNE